MDDLISKSKLIKEILEEANTKILDLESGITLGEMKECVENQPTVEAVPKTYVDQIRWERDIAIEQLNEIGCQFGQKMDEVKKKLEASQWIPCSERFPKIKEGEYCSDCVLVTLKWWDGELSETVGWYNNTGIWNEDGKMCKVIAWMPYEPYRQK